MEFMLWKAMFDIFKWSGNDRQSWSLVIIDTFSSDFQTMIVSDRRSWFGKMIMSDRRSRKKVSSLTLCLLHTFVESVFDISARMQLFEK